MAVADYVISQDIDVLALTEKWLGADTDQLNINELIPVGCEFNHIPHKVADRVRVISHKSGLAVTVSKSETMEIYTHFENMDYTINIDKITVTISIIQRPALSKQKMALETNCSLMNGLNT